MNSVEIEMYMQEYETVMRDIIGIRRSLAAYGQPCAPLVHAPVRSTSWCQGYLDPHSIIALRVAVRVVCI